MRIRPVHFSHFIASTLLLAGCRDAGPNAEATAPDPADLPASSSAVGGTEVVHFKARGEGALVNFTVEQPRRIVSGTIDVFRGAFSSEGETVLLYSLLSCDRLTGECAMLEEGVGTIPNGDFTVRGIHTTLRTNTSATANPSFDRFLGSGGPIVFRWTRTNAFVSQFHQQFRTRTKGLRIDHVDEAGTFSSAIASGTIFGLTVKPTSANVATIRRGTLLVSKVP
jgi:hypothetical protein